METKSKVRSSYYVWIPLTLLTVSCFLFLIYVFFPYGESIITGAAPAPLVRQDAVAIAVILINSALSGALGSLLSLMFRFRTINRINELRETGSMLLAQATVGAMTAVVFILVLKSAWIEFALLSGSWWDNGGTWALTPGSAISIFMQVTLVSFFVGLSEGAFLGLAEKMEGLLGGKNQFQSPPPVWKRAQGRADIPKNTHFRPRSAKQ